MRITNTKSAVLAVTALCGTAVLLSAIAAPPTGQSSTAVAPQEMVLIVDPAQSTVHYTVDSTLHTVHGTFRLKDGTVHFDPQSGKAGGQVSVNATSGDSGNGSRDAKMHKDVLQSQQFPDAIFRPEQVEGKVARAGASEVKLHGVLVVHGRDHQIIVPVHAQLAADRWTGTANFEVPYIEWGMKDPSNWLLKVKPVVSIELEMAGSAKNPD